MAPRVALKSWLSYPRRRASISQRVDIFQDDADGGTLVSADSEATCVFRRRVECLRACHAEFKSRRVEVFAKNKSNLESLGAPRAVLVDQ